MAAQPGLCRTWSKTPKTGFLTTRLRCHTELISATSVIRDKVICRYSCFIHQLFASIAPIKFNFEFLIYRYATIKEKFRGAHGLDPQYFARAPGRVNLIGIQVLLVCESIMFIFFCLLLLCET